MAFAVLSKKLIIELDREFHFTESGIVRDRKKDRWLADQGFSVLRIRTNELAEDLASCINTILHELDLMK